MGSIQTTAKSATGGKPTRQDIVEHFVVDAHKADQTLIMPERIVNLIKSAPIKLDTAFTDDGLTYMFCVHVTVAEGLGKYIEIAFPDCETEDSVELNENFIMMHYYSITSPPNSISFNEWTEAKKKEKAAAEKKDSDSEKKDSDSEKKDSDSEKKDSDSEKKDSDSEKKDSDSENAAEETTDSEADSGNETETKDDGPPAKRHRPNA